MTEAETILAGARAREHARDIAHIPTDWNAVSKMVRRQRAALTRARKTGDRGRLLVVCRDAVREWNRPGLLWPDDWSTWQIALNDVFPVFHAPQLEDLA